MTGYPAPEPDDDGLETAARLVMAYMQGTAAEELLDELGLLEARRAAGDLAEMLAGVIAMIGGTPAGLREALIAHRMRDALARVT